MSRDRDVDVTTTFFRGGVAGRPTKQRMKLSEALKEINLEHRRGGREKGSLNGGRTRPLSDFARSELASLQRRPRPRQDINAGVVDRLLRGAFVEIVSLPSPYKTVKGNVEHLQITNAGRRAVENV